MIAIEKFPRSLPWAFVALLVLNCIAIGASEPQRKAQVRTQRDPASATARLQRLVRHELVMLPYYTP